MLGWRPLSRYCQDYSDTHDAVEKRVRAGHWLKGVHVNKPAGAKELWANLDAINDWAAGRLPVHEHGKR